MYGRGIDYIHSKQVRGGRSGERLFLLTCINTHFLVVFSYDLRGRRQPRPDKMAFCIIICLTWFVRNAAFHLL